ncbi:unnamed protein product [Caretta caretta]
METGLPLTAMLSSDCLCPGPSKEDGGDDGPGAALRPATRRGRVAVGVVARTLAFPAWMDHRESPSHQEGRG